MKAKKVPHKEGREPKKKKKSPACVDDGPLDVTTVTTPTPADAPTQAKIPNGADLRPE